MHLLHSKSEAILRPPSDALYHYCVLCYVLFGRLTSTMLAYHSAGYEGQSRRTLLVFCWATLLLQYSIVAAVGGRDIDGTDNGGTLSRFVKSIKMQQRQVGVGMAVSGNGIGIEPRNRFTPEPRKQQPQVVAEMKGQVTLWNQGRRNRQRLQELVATTRSNNMGVVRSRNRQRQPTKRSSDASSHGEYPRHLQSGNIFAARYEQGVARANISSGKGRDQKCRPNRKMSMNRSPMCNDMKMRRMGKGRSNKKLPGNKSKGKKPQIIASPTPSATPTAEPSAGTIMLWHRCAASLRANVMCVDSPPLDSFFSGVDEFGLPWFEETRPAAAVASEQVVHLATDPDTSTLIQNDSSCSDDIAVEGSFDFSGLSDVEIRIVSTGNAWQHSYLYYSPSGRPENATEVASYATSCSESSEWVAIASGTSVFLRLYTADDLNRQYANVEFRSSGGPPQPLTSAVLSIL